MLWAAAAAADPNRIIVDPQFFIKFPFRYVSLFDKSKIREIGQAVRFGPQTDLSSFLEGFVFGFEQTFSVQENCEQAVLKDNSQCAPPCTRDFMLHTIRPRWKALRSNRKA